MNHEHNFDITKVDKIFNQLFSAGQLKLIRDHKLPSLEKIVEK